MHPHGPVPQGVPRHGGLATCMHANQCPNMGWGANTERMHTTQMQGVAQNQIAMQMHWQDVIQMQNVIQITNVMQAPVWLKHRM